MQQGVVADVLPPTETVNMSAADFDTSTPFVTAPNLEGGEHGPQTKKSPSGDQSDSSGVAAVVWVVVLVVLVVFAYVAVEHGRKRVAFVFAQPCAGGSIAEQSERGQFVQCVTTFADCTAKSGKRNAPTQWGAAADDIR